MYILMICVQINLPDFGKQIMFPDVFPAIVRYVHIILHNILFSLFPSSTLKQIYDCVFIHTMLSSEVTHLG